MHFQGEVILPFSFFSPLSVGISSYRQKYVKAIFFHEELVYLIRSLSFRGKQKITVIILQLIEHYGYDYKYFLYNIYVNFAYV